MAERCRPAWRCYLILWSTAFGDSTAETAAALAPLGTCPVQDRALLVDVNRVVTMADLFAVEVATFPEGHRYAVEIVWSDADPLVVLRGLRDRLARAPSLKTEILTAITGPSTLDASARDMAYSLAAPLYVGCYTVWENAADDDSNVRWYEETVQSLAPVTLGHYMGETDLTAAPDRAARSLAPGVWERLQAVRQKYAPQNLFYGHIGQA